MQCKDTNNERTSQALQALDALITDKLTRLLKYAERQDANKEYILRTYNEIEILQNIYDCVDSIKYLPLWEDIDKKIAEIQHNTDGICILIPFKLEKPSYERFYWLNLCK
jgi:hypothetical protein